MVKFTATIIGALAALAGVSAQSCVAGNYYCGYTLMESYGMNPLTVSQMAILPSSNSLLRICHMNFKL